jgi:hypothetical protein
MKIILSLIISGALVVSGFGQTRNVLVGTNNAVVQPTNFWSADASNARTGLGLGTSDNVTFNKVTTSNGNVTNPAIQIGTNASGISRLGSVLQFGINGTNIMFLSSSTLTVNGDILTSQAEQTRTNLGLGWSALTNTNSTNFRNAIGLGTTNDVEFDSLTIDTLQLDSSGGISWGGQSRYEPETQTFQGTVSFENGALLIVGTNASTFINQTRTNLGIPWSGLTNTNAATFQAALFGSNTNPVLVNTNGEVVSPTNFWQAAPITTTFIESQPNTNFTTNITPARFLHIHSLATNIANVTNTIVLPTNTLTFEGDVAIVVHKGPTNSMTRVQRAGSTNNLTTLTRFDEAVQFVYYNDVWQFDHNVAFVEPIYFSGTNAAANAAASRTNLGLGETNDVIFNSLQIKSVSTNSTSWRIFEDDGLVFTYRNGTNAEQDVFGIGTNLFGFYTAFQFSGTNANANMDLSRTNLGLGLPALTNTNNANFRNAIELGATNNVSFSNVTASGTLTATGTVTATTNLVVNGFVDFSTNHTNSNPATNNQINDFIEIRVGTNQFWLPVYK